MSVKLNITILFLIVLLDQSSFGVLLPIFSFLFSENLQENFIQQNFSNTQYVLYAIIFSVFSVFQFFSATILGELSDYYGRKKIISLSIVIVILSLILYILGIKFESITLLFLGRIFGGIGAGCIGVILAFISDISSEYSRVRNFSIIASASGLGLVVGPLFGGLFSDTTIYTHFSFYTPLYLLLVFNGICLCLFIFLTKEILILDKNKKINLGLSLVHIKKSLKDTTLKQLYLISFLFTCSLSLFIVFGSSFLISKFDLTTTSMSHFLLFFGACIVLAQIFLQRLYRNLHKLKVISLFSFVYLYGLFLMLNTISIFLTYASILFIAVSIGIIYPTILNIIDENTQPDDRGETMGINTSIQSLAQAISVLCAGILTHYISIKSIIFIIILGIFWLALLSRFRLALLNSHPE